ncbi:putative kinase [Achaetomium macrosporum]|uniref:Kinase n=1 Tax=Achaetomium macrosporum TaxID=79813 RepID=A0AAN7CIK7_9PEZI|nr:putative kinase [Achaetomium macrosporum]
MPGRSRPLWVIPPAKDIESRDEDLKESMRRVRRLIREKLRTQGKPVPDSPPSPHSLANSHPLSRELVIGGGEVIDEKLSCWMLNDACSTRVTKLNLRGIRPAEVEAMRFVSEYTTIPVPQVYYVGEQHFTMELIKDETLQKAWENTLCVEDRALVVHQLRHFINQLRTIRSQDGAICSFGGRSAVDARFLYVESGRSPLRPSNDFLVSDMLDDHEIVLTHSDLHACNITLAGFYPESLELVRPFRGAGWTNGFYKELLNIFPQRYDAEWLVETAFYQWTRHGR